MVDNAYLSSLQECSIIAEKEYEYISKRITDLEKRIENTKKNLDATISSYKNSSIESQDIDKTLTDISKLTKQSMDRGLDNLKNAFKTKKYFLSDFTVALFGRTKAGKSTIREALTNGNGDTIGKGAQRTTRDVRAYTWNHLRILDTPGFDAYKGEEDEKIAFYYVDQTDVILFLITSDNIEESEFEKLAHLRTQNKPVVILLNVLYDLNHPLYRKKLLKNPKKFVSMQAIEGHLKRLHFLSKKILNIDNINVIPIHAMAAFESNLSKDEDEKKQLYELSNFAYLNTYLSRMIRSEGKIKRIQSFRDDYIYYLEKDIESVYFDSHYSLDKTVKFLRKKHLQLSKWFDRFIPAKNNEIENEFKKMFAPLYRKIDDFVDQHIEDDNFGKKWNNEIKKFITEEQIVKIQEDIVDDLNDYLNEFYKEFQKDFNVIFFQEKFSSKGIKKSQTGKIARWSGVAVGTGSVAIKLLIVNGALANSWNPVGWGLTLVAIGIGIFSYFNGSDTKRFNQEKSKIKTKIRNNLEKMERKQRGATKTWFYKSITRGLQKKIKEDLRLQIEQLYSLQILFKQEGESVVKLVSEENYKLFERLVSIEFENANDIMSKIMKVARSQGLLWKVAINDNKLFPSKKEKYIFSKKIGEKIDEIRYSNNPQKYLFNCLRLKKDEVISYDTGNGTTNAEVEISQQNAGRAIGKQGVNVKLAEELYGKPIKIKVV